MFWDTCLYLSFSASGHCDIQYLSIHTGQPEHEGLQRQLGQRGKEDNGLRPLIPWAKSLRTILLMWAEVTLDPVAVPHWLTGFLFFSVLCSCVLESSFPKTPAYKSLSWVLLSWYTNNSIQVYNTTVVKNLVLRPLSLYSFSFCAGTKYLTFTS